MANATSEKNQQPAGTPPPMLCSAGGVTLQKVPYIYLIDINGNLLSCGWVANGQMKPTWFSQGGALGQGLQAAGGIATDQTTAYVFALDENENMWLNENTGDNNGAWTPMDSPRGASGPVQFQQCIGAALLGTSAFVFCVGDDGNVWLTSNTMKSKEWVTPGPIGNGITINMTIGAAHNGNVIQVYVIGSDNSMQVCNVQSDGSSSWESSPTAPIISISKPIGVVCVLGIIYVYGLDASCNLQCIYWDKKWVPVSLSAPPTGPCDIIIGVTVNCNLVPTVYVTDSNGQLYSNSNISGNGSWTPLGKLGPDITIALSVGVTSSPTWDYVFIFDQYGRIWGFTPDSGWVAMD